MAKFVISHPKRCFTIFQFIVFNYHCHEVMINTAAFFLENNLATLIIDMYPYVSSFNTRDSEDSNRHGRIWY